MRKTSARMLPVAILFGVAGCSKPDIRFELQPAVVSACTQPVSVRVEWDVTSLGLEQVRVEVNNLGRKPKLWVVGGIRGSEESGVWAHDGYTVILKTMDGVELGRRTLTTTPCPGMDWL